jgi:cytidyltransferase-like protein
MIQVNKEIVITSGYFNPLHVGHVSYLEEAKKLGDRLIVIVNNDFQVKLKGSKVFMNQKDRSTIIKALAAVDGVYISNSKDGSVCDDLEHLRKLFSHDHLIFAKGGDRTLGNIPEVKVCQDNNIQMIFNVGCAKTTSSSKILKEWEH